MSVARRQRVHEDRHQLRHHPLAQLAHEVTDAARRHPLLLAVRGGEVRDEARHQGGEQVLQRPRRVLDHCLPDLGAGLLHVAVLVAPDDVQGGEHVGAPLLREHLNLHQLGAVRWNAVHAEDLLDELACQLHCFETDAPVQVEDTILQGRQQQGGVRGAELLHQDLRGPRRRVPHGRRVVGPGPQEQLEDLGDVGLEGPRHRGGEVDEEPDVALPHLRRRVPAVRIGDDVRQEHLDAVGAHGHQHLREAVRRATPLHRGLRGAEHLEEPGQHVPEHLLGQRLRQGPEGHGRGGADVRDGVHERHLQLRQEQRQVRLDVLGVLDEQNHGAHEVRALALHLAGPLPQRPLHEGADEGERGRVDLVHEGRAEELVEDILRDVLELGAVREGRDELGREGAQLGARDDATDLVQALPRGVLHLGVRVVDHQAECGHDLRQAGAQLLRQAARHGR
mmetsp:Transcript_84798/g.240525  ORF Transcript_84798/g.240525 Transcript_84798/m.240525 type:complete len:450 (+) Transcript_84798:2220-3569(+)